MIQQTISDASIRADVSPEQKLELLRKLARIRAFEDEVERLNRAGRIPGFLHTSSGQEAVAVGVCEALQREDYVTSTHRGHGHCLAKGADLQATMCELYGKAPGQNRGNGGSMHVSDFSVNMLGANAIVGAGQGIAVGAALSAKLRSSGQVAVAFFGEGASSNGACHETMNLASILSVPVIFVCENNLYAHEAPASHMLPTPNVADRAPSYGMASWIMDGQDVLAVLGVMQEAVAHTRAESRPCLVEAKTYRYRGHHGGDPGKKYRPAEEIAAWLARDPILLLRAELMDIGVGEHLIDQQVQAAADEVRDAVQYAEAAAYPDVDEVFDHMFVLGGAHG